MNLSGQLLLDWRVRCAASHAPWTHASGVRAEALCDSIVRALEEGTAPADLHTSLRLWGAQLSSPSEARAVIQCLGEAVTVLAFGAFGDFRPRGLDPVLRQLALESIVPTWRRTLRDDVIDPDTGCPDRQTMEEDLATAVERAEREGLDVAVLVVALDDAPVNRRSGGETDERLSALLGAVLDASGPTAVPYRIGRCAFGVLVCSDDPDAIGDLVLTIACSGAPLFSWGTSSLRRADELVALSPDLLLFLAEADLQFRRRDHDRASRSVTTHRRLALVGSVAAATLLLVGAAAALVAPSRAPRLPEVAAPATVPSPAPQAQKPPPATTLPTPPESVPSSAPTLPAPESTVPVAASATPPATPAVLTSYQPPSATPPATTPMPPPPPPSTTTTVPAPRHGHSSGAPGHVKKG